MQYKTHLIPVEVSSGGFSTENAVSLELANGKTVSFFADKGLITTKGDKHFLSVTLVKPLPKQGKALILLPTEAFETASPWAEVQYC